MKQISIITVVKNGLPYLKTAIQSIKEQQCAKELNIEHIVVCSPSNDGTEEYLSKIDKIKLILDRNSKNKFESLNVGIENCSGDIIGILHADDVFYANDTLIKVLSNFNEDIDVVYGNILFSKKNDLTKINRVWKSSSFKSSRLLLGWMPPHTSIFVRKNILKNNLYETKYPISGDYYFILKLFNNNNYRFKHLNDFITIMRTGGDSTKIVNFFRKLREDVNIIKKFYNILFIITLLLKILSKINQIKFIKFNLNNEYIKKINEFL